MVLLALFGLLLVGIAVALLVRAVTLPRVQITSQLRQIDTYGFRAGSGAQLLADGPSVGAQFNELAERIGHKVRGRGLLAPIELRLLRAAGMYKLTPEIFQGYRVMAALGVPGLLLLDSLATGAKATNYLLVIVAAGICWVLPKTMVISRAQRRMNEVDRRLPELIDVLIATVEAGLGFAGSLQLVADRFDGPLGQELRLMLHEQSMGLSTEKALANLLERCDTASVRAFVRAVTQGETLGVSIGTMLRNLASETRKRRRQSMREQIMKAPVKMLFPLVFLILPSLFLVLLYPAATNIMHALGAR
jgi:tight adherence protein C